MNLAQFNSSLQKPLLFEVGPSTLSLRTYAETELDTSNYRNKSIVFWNAYKHTGVSKETEASVFTLLS